ncbi:MAG TPA: fumarylacetoacetate hydrolase family protein [Planctomycetaceae bacterium]|jgi:2-dehydro-3-deoxy-D-arabinonate dehydratase|nr:fumarylacetoacetate hydrolase family protein [Planctomycetaceae bacterium]
MKLAKIRLADGTQRLAAVENDDRRLRLLDLEQVEKIRTLADILHSPDPLGLARFLIDPKAEPIDVAKAMLLAPIDDQEVWAAGVTYKRSQVARMDESQSGAIHYDKVYTADRPELFFKATASRVSGPGEPVRVRFDSQWSVPEPEWTLIVSDKAKVVGFTLGNDMSARDIEGENPLYLPQAKLYKQSCALGPWVLVPEGPLEREKTKIGVSILRKGKPAFEGTTDLGQMVRTFEDLIGWLVRENEFPNGAFLLTGTGVVPPDDFGLEDGDIVSIQAPAIGTLTNPVLKETRPPKAARTG